MIHIAALVTGFLMDLILGDPLWLPHPVRLMGKTIGWCEGLARRLGGDRPGRLLAGGALLCLIHMALWPAAALAVCLLAGRLHPAAGYAAESFMMYQLLAAKSLKTESMKVLDALAGKDLEGGRRAVSMIVGRDTDALDESGVIRAAVETVAENLSDGVIAPMLFMALGGAAGGYLYKVVNTMDSMIGYKDERYLWIGRWAARADDCLNLIPSRASALLLVASAWLLGLDAAGAWRIWRRDCRNHASPNSAQTESAVAGALGVRLAGDARYFGKLCHKPALGDDRRPVQKEDIAVVNRMMYASSFLGLGFLTAAAALLHLLWIG